MQLTTDKIPFIQFMLTAQIKPFPCRRCQANIFHIGSLCHGHTLCNIPRRPQYGYKVHSSIFQVVTELIPEKI